VSEAIVTATTILVDLQVTPIEAALLMRGLDSLKRIATGIQVPLSTLTRLGRAVKGNPPAAMWNRLRWYLRIRTMMEAA
jgi:hypothetical protein